MRLHDMRTSLFALVVASCLLQSTIAAFIPEFLHNLADLQDVEKRCNRCGYYGQLCCDEGTVCITDVNNQAACSAVSYQTQAPAAVQGGSWQYTTTTFVQTDRQTITMTLSSFVAQATASCQYSLGEHGCGSGCCSSTQYCNGQNVCVDNGGGNSGYYSNMYTVTTIITSTAGVGVPLRPTSDTLVTITSTGLPTTTQTFIPPSGTDGSVLTGASSSSGGGLSGGAIAGIVIGVILGIIILLIICACCCFKGLLDGLLAIFGLGPNRKRRVETEEVYESRHHGRTGRTWFGTRPSRPNRTSVVEEKKSSGWSRGVSLAAFLGGLAVILGLKRRSDRKDDKSTAYGSSYYSDYTSSSSESSSDRRTRRSSRSRSRASRR